MPKALGMIETWGLAISIEVAETMLKAANVRLVHQETEDIALVTIIIEGEMTTVQMAVAAGVKVAQRTKALLASSVIPHPQTEAKKLANGKRKGQLK